MPYVTATASVPVFMPYVTAKGLHAVIGRERVVTFEVWLSEDIRITETMTLTALSNIRGCVLGHLLPPRVILSVPMSRFLEDLLTAEIKKVLSIWEVKRPEPTNLVDLEHALKAAQQKIQMLEHDLASAKDGPREINVLVDPALGAMLRDYGYRYSDASDERCFTLDVCKLPGFGACIAEIGYDTTAIPTAMVMMDDCLVLNLTKLKAPKRKLLT